MIGCNVPSVTAASVLADCHAVGQTGAFILGDHARDRARERNIRFGDIKNALRSATEALLQDNGRWQVSGGVALDGVPITFIVTVFRGFVIVTLF